MNNLKNYTEYITEMKSEESIVKDLARHLAFKKEVIKYLNTSRAKRELGWRDFLMTMLHGKQLDYVNYITKNMVADYNKNITGHINYVDDDNERYSDSVEVEDDREISNLEVGEIINDIDKRVSNIEDTLGIDPNDKETVDKAKAELKKIGYDPDWVNDEEEAEEE